ncbi:MAG: hypothetical protein KDA50_00570 [Rhodobacteraceae bacterium]|nr:hypothetical protein [Paracoccaceae bacterium]
MNDIILFRIGERLTLSAMVLLVAVVVMIGFWRSVQKIDLSEGGKLGLGGSFVFSTPVFVLLAIIGYAWVSLEHPIQVMPPSGDAPTQTASAAAPAGQFIGSAAVAARDDADPGYDRAIAQRRIRSLNCLALDHTPSARTADDLAEIKLGILRDLWLPEWGDPAAFADWALGRSLDAPADAARAAWEEVHPLC